MSALQKLSLDFQRWFVVRLVRFHWRGKRTDNLVVTNQRIPVDGGTIGVRLYTPHGDGPFPILHFFHGGGWIGCNLDTHDFLCRDLCVTSRHVVVSVDYRLAPEYPFPIPVHDCLTSLDWIVANARRLNADPDRLILCGDSAGGNLAAVVAQQARTRHPGLVKGQVLIYPATDNLGHAQWPSYQTHGGKGFALTYEKAKQLWHLYLRNSPLWNEGMTSHELATPLHVSDLSQLPRTLVVIAEEDMLKDEAQAYALKIRQAGADVTVKRYAHEQHGFVGLAPRPGHKAAVADIAAWTAIC